MQTDHAKIKTLLRIGEASMHVWPDYIQQYGFTQDDIPELIAVLARDDLIHAALDSSEAWAPVHAWRTLGQLKCEQAIPGLIHCFDYLHDDDWALNEFHRVFALIGPAAIPALATYLQQPVADEFSHIMAVDALAEIALTHPAQRDAVLGIFNHYMQQPNETAYQLNGLLIGRLLDLGAKESIEDIRRLFSLDCVDNSCAGDLEEVEILLGLRHQRSTPKPNYAQLRGLDFPVFDSSDDDAYGVYDMPSATWQPPYTRPAPKIGRNDPCPCGSGKKFKKCCGAAASG